MFRTLRKPLYAQSLAIAMAYLMIPKIGVLRPISPVPEASAQGITLPICSPGQSRIFQNICVTGYTELLQFEKEVVQSYLAAHRMQPSDEALLYKYGRSDLRTEIRSLMWLRMMNIIRSNSRTSAEQRVYDTLTDAVWANEKRLYENALADYRSWQNNPCTWRPDPLIAEANGLRYDPAAFCGTSLSNLLYKPRVPKRSYFMGAAMKPAYYGPYPGPAETKLLTDTSSGLGLAAGIATAAAAAVGATWAAAVVTSSVLVKFIFPFAVSKIIAAGSTGFSAALATGPAAIIGSAIIIGVVCAFDAFENDAAVRELAAMQTDYNRLQTQAPDLRAFLDDATGYMKVSSTFVAWTLGEFASTEALPAHGNSDAKFVINLGAAVDSFTYRDWDGASWSATSAGRWLVQTKASSNVTSFSPSMRILRPGGTKYYASRSGGVWILTKASPADTDKDCPADAFTGVSSASGPTCRAYVSNTLEMVDGSGQTAVVNMAEEPRFVGQAADYDLTFTSGIPREVTFQATGGPLPSITGPVAMAAGLAFEGSSTAGAGIAKVRFTNAAAGEYTYDLRATNAVGSTTVRLRIRVLSEVKITSANSATFTKRVPGSFKITASGSFVRISLNFPLPEGLSFRDNLDGSATISGSVDPDTSYLRSCLPACSITATNGAFTDVQEFKVDVLDQPAATLNIHEAAFTAGKPNAIRVVASGSTTAPAFLAPCPYTDPIEPPGMMLPFQPKWLTVVDNGDGTATLHGTPPMHTTDYEARFKLVPTNNGFFAAASTCQSHPEFKIKVSTGPLFTSGSYGVSLGGDTNLSITTNSSSGTITMAGSLPGGLTLRDNGNGTANIIGKPSASGAYPLTLTLTTLSYTAGRRTTSQAYTLHVLEPASYNGPREATFHAGAFNSMAFAADGYPKSPVPELASFNQSYSQGLSLGLMIFSGAPAGVAAKNASAVGLASGTAVLSGTPALGAVGVYNYFIRGGNGYGTGVDVPFTLYIVKAGDVNRDGKVDCMDLNTVTRAKGGLRGFEGYVSPADTNNDGFVNDTDEQFVFSKLEVPHCNGTPPAISVNVSPDSALEGQPVTFSGTITPGTEPISSSYLMSCDLTPIGGASGAMATINGLNWSLPATVASGTAPGPKIITCRIADDRARANQGIVGMGVKPFSCGGIATEIGKIQGTTPVSPLVGNTVEIEGVVSGAFQGPSNLHGYFVQDAGDGNLQTSDGIFVDETSGSHGAVRPGQKVRLRGTVAEKGHLTTLQNVTHQATCGLGNAIEPIDILFPLELSQNLEQFESMSVRFPQRLFVTDTANLGRFNEVTLAAPPQTGGANVTRLYAPTQVMRPGPEAQRLQSLNDRSQIILDDGSDLAYGALLPQATWPKGLGGESTLRLGTAINIGPQGNYIPLVGVVTQGADSQYRLQPTGTVSFRTTDNPRPQSVPKVSGRLRVASVNGANYFTTPGTGGADNAAELARQREKLAGAIAALDAAVVAVTSVENNTAALLDLVNAINAKSTPGKYTAVVTGTIGMHASTAALLYQSARVQPAGVHKVLDSTVHAGAMTQRNRPAIAQTFKLLAGERPGAQHFTIVAAQLRDRSSGCGTDGGPQDGDRLDGQGECNLTRLSMARTLMDWLSTNPTADPTPADNRRFLIVGDFNAYLSEDPVEALTNRAFTAGASAVFPGGLAASSRATYIHLGRALMAQPAYSHAIAGQSGELDHGLANPALYRAVSGVARWKINADEPVVFDYNLDFSSNGSPVLRSQGQLTSYYSPGPTRSADRDPLVVDFNPLCGDVNDDGDVDNTDGALVRNAIGSTPVNRRYDLDLDRQVTMADFRIVQACLAEARSAK